MCLEVTEEEIENAFKYVLQKNNQEVTKVQIINGLNNIYKGYGMGEYTEQVPYFNGINVTIKNKLKQKVKE